MESEEGLTPQNTLNLKIGDEIRFKADHKNKIFVVWSLAGRLGGLVTIKPKEEPKASPRQYYFHCFVRA